MLVLCEVYLGVTHYTLGLVFWYVKHNNVNIQTPKKILKFTYVESINGCRENYNLLVV